MTEQFPFGPQGHTSVWMPSAFQSTPHPEGRFDAGGSASSTTPPPSRQRKRRWLFAAVPALALVAALGGGAVGATVAHDATAAPSTRIIQSDGANPDWTQTAAAASPSVVAISVDTAQGTAEGSGVVYDKAGRIVTNNHVVAGAQRVDVTLSDQRVYHARVVGTDPSTDLAVLELIDGPTDLQPMALADSEKTRVGQPVMAIGNPLGLNETVTTGIVSAVDRPVVTQGASTAERAATNAIQTNAAINPGNSGGALVNANGELLGITSSIATVGHNSGEAGNIGIGFAIPADEVKSVVDQIIDADSVQHAWLGVATRPAQAATGQSTVAGAGVAELVPDSPAASAGIATGDVITALDGDPINGPEALMAAIRARSVGDTATVTLVRDNRVRDVSVSLAAAAQ